MTTVTSMKCACEKCLCVVSLEDASPGADLFEIAKNGKYYCCEACANGHPNHEGCGQQGCGCC